MTQYRYENKKQRKIPKVFLVLIIALAAFLIYSFTRSPVIAVVYHDSGSRDNAVYYRILEENNAEAIYIQQNATSLEEAEELIKLVDGIIFVGGKDIDPALYNSDQVGLVEDVNYEDDLSDLYYMEAAYKLNKPALGVCRGLQLMNVLFGGTLYEDIPTQYPRDILHRDEEKKVFVNHRVIVSPNTKVYRMLGGVEYLEVNSWHHQGIDELAYELSPVAHSEDGLIEAVELKGHPFFVGVQWHPEWMTESDDYHSNRIFSEFVNHCK